MSPPLHPLFCVLQSTKFCSLRETNWPVLRKFCFKGFFSLGKTSIVLGNFLAVLQENLHAELVFWFRVALAMGSLFIVKYCRLNILGIHFKHVMYYLEEFPFLMQCLVHRHSTRQTDGQSQNNAQSKEFHCCGKIIIQIFHYFILTLGGNLIRAILKKCKIIGNCDNSSIYLLN